MLCSSLKSQADSGRLLCCVAASKVKGLVGSCGGAATEQAASGQVPLLQGNFPLLSIGLRQASMLCGSLKSQRACWQLWGGRHRAGSQPVEQLLPSHCWPEPLQRQGPLQKAPERCAGACGESGTVGTQAEAAPGCLPRAASAPAAARSSCRNRQRFMIHTHIESPVRTD